MSTLFLSIWLWCSPDKESLLRLRMIKTCSRLSSAIRRNGSRRRAGIWTRAMFALSVLITPLWLSGQNQPATTETPKIEPIRESITVTATISADTPAAVSVLHSTQLAESPGVNIDDRLRDVPGFTLFRRSSSVVANPTTQGVSLRGIGSSGASRTLGLFDGMPENDPF